VGRSRLSGGSAVFRSAPACMPASLSASVSANLKRNTGHENAEGNVG